MGSVKVEDRLAALNMLLFTVALADGHYCPRRPKEFVDRVVQESLCGGTHLDLWMKDLSPEDSREILRSINTAGRKLSKLTIGSSHTGGAGVGTFLRGHATLKVNTVFRVRGGGVCCPLICLVGYAYDLETGRDISSLDMPFY